MKKRYFNYIVLLLVLVGFLFSACQPKIYGQRKRKRVRDCGCELIQPSNQTLDLVTYNESDH